MLLCELPPYDDDADDDDAEYDDADGDVDEPPRSNDAKRARFSCQILPVATSATRYDFVLLSLATCRELSTTKTARRE